MRTLKVSSSCFEKTEAITLAKGEVKHVSFQIDIPESISDKESDFSFTVELDGKAQEMTAFLR